MHSTMDDGFILLEMNLWTSQVAEAEREKKCQTVYHARHDATILILNPIEYNLRAIAHRFAARSFKCC
jgi:hypothetical protein